MRLKQDIELPRKRFIWSWRRTRQNVQEKAELEDPSHLDGLVEAQSGFYQGNPELDSELRANRGHEDHEGTEPTDPGQAVDEENDDTQVYGPHSSLYELGEDEIHELV